MEPVSNDTKAELMIALKEDHSIKNSWGSNRGDFEENLTFPWPYDREEYWDRFERTKQFLDEIDVDLFLIAFRDEQYTPEAKNFIEEKDYVLKIKAEEIPENSRPNEFLVVPEDVGWTVVFDHDGNIGFSGDPEFIEEVKSFFPDWETLTHRTAENPQVENYSVKGEHVVVNPQIELYFSSMGARFRNEVIKGTIGSAFQEFKYDIDYDIRIKVDVDRHVFLDELRSDVVKSIHWDKDDLELKISKQITSSKESSLYDQMMLFFGNSYFMDYRDLETIDYNWQKVLGLAVGYSQIRFREPVFQRNRDKEYLRENIEEIIELLSQKFNIQEQNLFTGTNTLQYWIGFHLAYLLAKNERSEDLLEFTEPDVEESLKEILRV